METGETAFDTIAGLVESLGKFAESKSRCQPVRKLAIGLRNWEYRAERSSSGSEMGFETGT